MFLANLFSRICSARAQFLIVVANQRASFLFSTWTIRGVLVLRSAYQLNSGQSKSGVWSIPQAFFLSQVARRASLNWTCVQAQCWLFFP